MRKRNLSNVQIIATGYLIIAVIGTILLMLPISSKSGVSTPFLTSFFTAVSASCVTGLVLVDTVTHWSLFGQLVILLLIQTGGLGFMSVATFFLTFSKKNIDLRKRSIMAESINSVHIAGLKKITRTIILGTLIFELTGAVLFSIRFIPEFGVFKGIYYSVFHSVSAFCNAGFDLMGEKEQFCSFLPYSDDLLINVTLIILITVGGIGFLVWDDILKNGIKIKKYSLHTKIVLVVSAVLTFGGAFIIFCLENDNMLSDFSLKEKILVSLFSSVTCRTAGFNTADFSALSHSTILIMCFLMFTGGSSGSVAGGVKTTTVAVIFAYLIAGLKGVSKPHIFGRAFEEGTLKKAVTICAFSLSLIFISVVAVCAIDGFSLTDVLFEVVSAMGTVGMTRDLTRSLSEISQLIIISLMYIGRVGSISFALALLEKRAQPSVNYPTEAITVG